MGVTEEVVTSYSVNFPWVCVKMKLMHLTLSSYCIVNNVLIWLMFEDVIGDSPNHLQVPKGKTVEVHWE